MNDDQLIAILNGLAEAVLLLDSNRKIVLANPAASKLFGDDLVGRDVVRAVRHPECLDMITKVLGGTERAKGVVTMEAPLEGTFEISVTELAAENADNSRLAISFSDITHIKHAEQMRSDFVANVSHELRSPLTSLSGIIETLKGPAKGDDDATARFLELMESEAWRMNRLIGDLLSLSKVEADERVRPSQPVDLVAIIKDVIATQQVQIDKENKSVKLDSFASAVSLPGDHDQLIQVFQNLIENAVKYGAAGSEVVVTLRRQESVPNIRGPALTISVKDHGEGIEAIHIPRLTERFYRVDTGRSRDMGGTGLGLAIVKHIVNRHRGRLQIESAPGKGSTFSVHLPIEVR